MARTAITDNIWEQLQTTMKAHGCHQWQNDRTVWKRYYGNSGQGPYGET